MAKGKVSRRQFIRVSALTAAGIVVSSCGAPEEESVEEFLEEEGELEEPEEEPTEEPEEEPTEEPEEEPIEEPEEEPSKYSEAPMLAELVEAGELPPVDERLPVEPLVVEPVEEIGEYGGTWQAGVLGTADTAWLTRITDYEPLVRWNRQWTGVIPGVAKSWDVSSDGTTFTFYLREGMRWSDGEPFTADDLLFTYEDIWLNEDLSPVFPKAWSAGGEPVEMSKVDEYTVDWTFVEPHGLLLKRLAEPGGTGVYAPKHYLRQFHPTYADEEELEKEVQDAGYDEWFEMFGEKNDKWANADCPSADAWHVDTELGTAPQVTFDRNRYYWKVDSEGNQLPYIDSQFLKVYEDPETIAMDAVAGNIDMQDRHIGTTENRPMFEDNKEQGDYGFFQTRPSGMNTNTLALNLTHKDPVKREIFQNKDFRIALSHAINREEINDVVYYGLGELWQWAPLMESAVGEKYPDVCEELGKQYTEYDPDKANAILDEIFPEKDGDGFRLGPDGERIRFAVDVCANHDSRVDALTMIEKYWEEVGIDMDVKTMDRSIFYERKEANEHDADVWGGDGGLNPITEPRWYFPYSAESNYAEAWQMWYNSNGEQGEEPPEPTKRQMEIYDEILQTPDEDEQIDLFKEILEIAIDQFYGIGVCTGAPGYGIVKNNMHNVPEEFPGSWLYPNPGPVDPCQFFKS